MISKNGENMLSSRRGEQVEVDEGEQVEVDDRNEGGGGERNSRKLSLWMEREREGDEAD